MKTKWLFYFTALFALLVSVLHIPDWPKASYDLLLAISNMTLALYWQKEEG